MPYLPACLLLFPDIEEQVRRASRNAYLYPPATYPPPHSPSPSSALHSFLYVPRSRHIASLRAKHHEDNAATTSPRYQGSVATIDNATSSKTFTLVAGLCIAKPDAVASRLRMSLSTRTISQVGSCEETPDSNPAYLFRELSLIGREEDRTSSRSTSRVTPTGTF